MTPGSESTPAAAMAVGGASGQDRVEPPTRQRELDADADLPANQAGSAGGAAPAVETGPAQTGGGPGAVEGVRTVGGAGRPAAASVPPRFQGLRPAAGEASAAVRLAIVLLLAGIPLGVLWWALAPRRVYEVTDQGAFAVVPESEAAVGTDGWFLLLTGALGLAAAALVWRRGATRGPLIPVGLAIGMLLCGLLSWQLGAVLGPRPSAAALDDTGALVLGPLELRAYGVLTVGPFLAVAGYLLAVCFAPRDDLRAAGAPHDDVRLTGPAPAPPPSVG